MSITIGNYSFEGPFGDTSNLGNNSGVYAILSRRTSAERYTVIDIGEAGWIRDRITCHDRRDQWTRHNHGSLSVAALYCDETARMRIERELRTQYNPVCGDR
ncbi:MAG: hypothetical protein KDK89_14275 [Alphaproteobacteria bacterium]|nr:hypothetical protein [Alphaproteobacteria bacterium]